MKITFVYPAFERHADAHPELKAWVPANEYIGPPSLGIACVAAATPPGHTVEFIDDRVTPFNVDHESDLFALSFFTPAATRAIEIADALRARGKRVVAGGIFPSMMPEAVASHFDAVVVGEGEPVWADVVNDAEHGALRPRYSAPPADLAPLVPPQVDLYLGAERDGYRPDDYPLQISRGCPLHCDACVLPEYLAPKMRFHSMDYLTATMKRYAAAGKLASFTEDTSFFPQARRGFRELIELCVKLQGEGLNLRLSYIGISLPIILNLDPTLLADLKRTGIDRFYVVGGFDPVTRGAFGPGDPKMLDKAVRAIARCHEFGIDPYVSFLVGNRDDDEGTFDRMLEFTRVAKIDLAEFCISTPYPGTPIWRRYNDEGRVFDRAWKHYNDANIVFRPHNMTPERLFEGYLYLWREFYQGRARDMSERPHTRSTIQF
ncbi:MAG: B12-binding domain-containing radical SAM protein [Deltaproteobacteria bacterium]|nr:B12-binding domain-containing radical SAM protein [Deltaproteobacteria bacterium]